MALRAVGKGGVLSLTRTFAEAYGKPSVGDAIKAGAWKVLVDGNLGETLVEHGPGSTLVGVDQFGNKYFEKKGAQVGRNRWVMFPDPSGWRVGSSGVPPEWHGWLHFITDANPTNTQFKAEKYAVEASLHPTMSPQRYLPKGSWHNPERRRWRKFQAWSPPPARGGA